MSADYTKTVFAADSATAQVLVKAMAKRDGLRVRTVKAVRLEAPPVQLTMPRYTVTLAVDTLPALPERSECA